MSRKIKAEKKQKSKKAFGVKQEALEKARTEYHESALQI